MQCFGSRSGWIVSFGRTGSTSGNVDPDPGSKKNRDKLEIQINQNHKNIIFLKKKSLVLFNMNNKLKITKKNMVMSFKAFTGINKKEIKICQNLGRIRSRIRIRYPGSGSGSASKWRRSETLLESIAILIVVVFLFWFCFCESPSKSFLV